MITHLKHGFIVTALTSTIIFVGCSKKEAPSQIEVEKEIPSTIDPENVVFYDLGKSAKSIKAEQEQTESTDPKPSYVECDSDTDCLIKNKHFYNPFDPVNTGVDEGQKIPVETKEPAKPLNDEIFNLIDELGSVEQDLNNHHKQATSATKSEISMKIEKEKEAEILDEIEREMQNIEARRIMQD